MSVALASLLVSVGAWAFFSGSGQGSAQAAVATLNGPSSVTATTSVGLTTVSVGWASTTLSNGLAVDGYYITRTTTTNGATSAACGTSSSSLTTGTSCTDTGVPLGTYTYSVTAVFRTWTGTGTSGAVTVSPAPTATITFPANSGSYKSSSWSSGCNVPPFGAADTVCGTAGSGVTQVQVSIQRTATLRYWDGSSFASTPEVKLTASGTTNWTRGFPAGNFPADDTYTVRVYASDGAGNTSSATTASFLIDNTAPTGSVSAPAASASVRGSVTVSSSSVDAGSGVASVVFQRSPSGGNTWTTIGTVTGSPYQVSWTTTGVSDGLYDLRVVTTDVAGNSFTSSIVSVRVDNTAPTGSVSAPAASANVRASVTVSSSSADAGSGVASAVFQRSPSGGNTWTTIGTATGSPYQVSWDTTAVSDGLYDLRVVTTDVAGNSVTSSTVTVRVDNTAPTGSLTAPANNASVRLTVTVSSSSADSGSGVASAAFQRSPNGANTWTTIGTATSSPYQVSWTTWGVSDGLYNLRVVTTDSAGNTFTSATITVTVNNGFASDTFTDTSGLTLASHAGEVGASWARLAGTLTAQITSAGRLRRNGTSSSSDTAYYASGTPSSADYTVQADIFVASSLGSDWAGVVGRASTTLTTYYAAWYVNSSSTHRWELWRFVNGSGTSLGTFAQGLTTGQTYTVGLSMVGTTIKLLVNGTAQITVTDALIATAGKAGVYVKGSTAIDDTKGLQLDNFFASN